MNPRRLVFLTLLSLVLALSGYAQTATSMTGDIPFEFVVGNKTLPAGQYTLRTYTPMPGAWVLSSSQDRAGVFVATATGNSKEASNQSSLVFERYGGRYFLSQIRSRIAGQSVIPKSHLERELIKTTSIRHETALIALR